MGDDEIAISIPCPICRKQVKGTYKIKNDDGDIARFIETVVRLQCIGCEEIFTTAVRMVAEEDLDDLPYDPEKLEARRSEL